MIDKSKDFWHGDCADDVIEYLDEYTENAVGKTVIVKCTACTLQEFSIKIDEFEGAIEVACIDCGEKRLLLDSEDAWEECEPEEVTCPVCNKDVYNVGVGFVYRDSGEVKWVYIAHRCTGCGVLGSSCDWKISYAPTDELERNV